MTDRDNRKELLALGLILLASFLLRLAFLHEPFERDEGTYAYIGQEILRGAIPYRDMVDLKPPGIYYLYALMISTFGATVEGIRLFTACYATATTYFVYLFVRTLYTSSAALTASLLFALFAGAPRIHGSSSNSEVFLLLPLVVSALFVYRASESGKCSPAAWGGFFTGIAMIIKTVALPFALFYLAFLLVRVRTRGPRIMASLSAAFVLPPLMLAAGTLLYFAAHGALHDFFYWNTAFSKLFGPPPDMALRFWLGLRESSEYLLLWLAALPAAIWLLTSGRDRRGVYLTCLIPVSFMAVALPRWFSSHYFIIMIPFLAVVAGIGLDELRRRGGTLWHLSLPVIALALLYTIARDYPFYLVYTPAEVSRAKYGANEDFPASIEIARYLKERTLPGEYIFQWGWEPELYFLADRRAPNKYIYSLIPAAAEDPGAAVRELQESILATKPKFIVMQTDGPTTQHSKAPGFYQLTEILSRHYTLDRVIGYGVIFRLTS